MYIQQADLFHGLNRDFVKDVMANADKIVVDDGHVLFSEGDPAHSFYVLLKGRVRLSLADTGQVYMVSRSGEAFGWSSLVGRPTYSATATCAGPTKLLAWDKKTFEAVVERDPKSAMLFFKHLAKTLGFRLIQSYAAMTGRSLTPPPASAGTGQVIEAPILT